MRSPRTTKASDSVLPSIKLWRLPDLTICDRGVKNPMIAPKIKWAVTAIGFWVAAGYKDEVAPGNRAAIH